MPTPKELLTERILRVETIPDRFINAVTASQDELFAELIEILSQLGLSNGDLQLTQANMILIDNLMNEYYERLRNGKYGGLVAGYLQEFDRQKAISDSYIKLEFGFVAKETSQIVFNNAKNEALQLLLGDSFKTNFINVIRDQVVQNVEARAPFPTLRDNLLKLFTKEERLPIIESWTKQVASDSFAIADRSYNNEVGNELGLQFAQYAGGLIADSRPFCVERAERIFHINEVESWASLQWQGKFRNTTAQNISQVLGGYNCQHVLVWRSLANVPREVILRNIEKGNFKPSDREKQLLNL